MKKQQSALGVLRAALRYITPRSHWNSADPDSKAKAVCVLGALHKVGTEMAAWRAERFMSDKDVEIVGGFRFRHATGLRILRDAIKRAKAAKKAA